MRRRFRWDPATKTLIEVGWESRQPRAPAVWGDLPGYESPASGLWIEGRKARREDLKRTGCRPYEGFESEKREADKWRAEQDRKLDQLADKMAHKAWAEAPERVRKVFRGK
jgi:hypothetical protein